MNDSDTGLIMELTGPKLTEKLQKRVRKNTAESDGQK